MSSVRRSLPRLLTSAGSRSSSPVSSAFARRSGRPAPFTTAGRPGRSIQLIATGDPGWWPLSLAPASKQRRAIATTGAAKRAPQGRGGTVPPKAFACSTMCATLGQWPGRCTSDLMTRPPQRSTSCERERSAIPRRSGSRSVRQPLAGRHDRRSKRRLRRSRPTTATARRCGSSASSWPRSSHTADNGPWRDLSPEDQRQGVIDGSQLGARAQRLVQSRIWPAAHSRSLLTASRSRRRLDPPVIASPLELLRRPPSRWR